MKNERIIKYINNRYNIPLIMEYNYKTKMNNKNIIKRNIYNLHKTIFHTLYLRRTAYIVQRTLYTTHFVQRKPYPYQTLYM